jgi:hypothetical protein
MALPSPTPKRPYVPLKPKYDTSRGTPGQGDNSPPGSPDNPLEGPVEKSDTAEGPPAKKDTPPHRTPSRSDPPHRTPSGQGERKSDPPLRGQAEEKGKPDDDIKAPTGAYEKSRHQSANDPKKKSNKREFGVQWTSERRSRWEKKYDDDNYGAFLCHSAQVGIKKTSEGIEGKAEINVSVVQTKCSLYKGRHGSVTLQSDMLTAKAAASVVMKNERGRVKVGANLGGEAKLFDVQVTGQKVFPLFNGMGIQITGQASAGIGAAAEGHFGLDTGKSMHFDVHESIGMGPMQKLGFSIDLVKMKK